MTVFSHLWQFLSATQRQRYKWHNRGRLSGNWLIQTLCASLQHSTQVFSTANVIGSLKPAGH